MEASVPYSLGATETVKVEKVAPAYQCDRLLHCGFDAGLIALTMEQDEDTRLSLVG